LVRPTPSEPVVSAAAGAAIAKVAAVAKKNVRIMSPFRYPQRIC
jgi:hypothetical protein